MHVCLRDQYDSLWLLHILFAVIIGDKVTSVTYIKGTKWLLCEHTLTQTPTSRRNRYIFQRTATSIHFNLQLICRPNNDSLNGVLIFLHIPRSPEREQRRVNSSLEVSSLPPPRSPSLRRPPAPKASILVCWFAYALHRFVYFLSFVLFERRSHFAHPVEKKRKEVNSNVWHVYGVFGAENLLEVYNIPTE